MELHHIVPRKSGGKYTLNNVAPLHQTCHNKITHGNHQVARELTLTAQRLSEDATKSIGPGKKKVKGSNPNEQWLKRKERLPDRRDRKSGKHDCTSRVR